jgi:quinoprotein glucose dehydrogenase
MFRATLVSLAVTATLPVQAAETPVGDGLASTHAKDAQSINGLTPTTVVAGVHIPADTTLKVEATYQEQKLTSPTAITFDDQGRIYVSETHRFRKGIEDDRDHLYWFLDDLAARKTSDRLALHEKWKEKLPLDKLTANSEIIRRLADTDGDGRIDESKVFADGLNDMLDGTAAGVFYYEGSLYFACIPKIYALRDTNGDGTADERKVVAEGFGVRISLSGHDLNGFTLGPDGRIYGTVGDRGFSLITKEGVKYDYPNEGAAFRCEPDGTGLEIFHTGLRNPKEIAFDALGNAFTVDNNSDQGDLARVVYLVEGGDSGWQMEHQAMHTFHRQIGLKDHPPSRWMDEKMWELENPAQPAYMLPPCAHLTSGPSGLTAHPGAGFLESEAGRFLICDYRGSSANSGIWSFEMKPKGAGMEMSDARKFAWGIAATDVEYSWDGRVYISDFVGGWSSHEDGRLLSLTAGANIWQAAEAAGAAKIMKEGFEQRGSTELANLLKHPDARIRLRAQLALTRKPDALKRFTDATESSNFLVRIHGIQGLGILSRRGSSPLPAAEFAEIPTAKIRTEAETKLINLLADKNPEIRAQSLRALAYTKNANAIPLGPLLSDTSPRVRFFAAMLIGKQKVIGYYGPICDMLAENDNRDVYLRHAGIFALERMASNPMILSSLVSHESAAVRLAATVALRRLKNPSVSVFIKDRDPKVADEAIRAVCDNDIAARRPAVAALLDDLTKREWSPFMLRRLVHNAYRIGTPENCERVLKLAADPKIPEPVRQEAFRLLILWTDPFPADQFTGHWRPLEKRDPAAIRPPLLAALPELLKQYGFTLTSALELVRTYQLEVPGLDDTALSNLVKNEKLPAEARVIALELFIGLNPKNLNALLTETAGDSSDPVALAALAALARLSPATALPALDTAIKSTSYPRAQKAWGIIASLPPEPHVEELIANSLRKLSDANGIQPDALELMAAAKKRTALSVVEGLARLEQALSQKADPFTENNDPLAKWNPALEGGDPVAGAALFKSHPAGECMRCHRAEVSQVKGSETAPNLAGIANRSKDRRYFLESMINPAAVIAPGFGVVLIEFKNGASLTGNLLAETPEHLDIETAGKALRIKRGDVASFTPPTASAMPPMAEVLQPHELRDLIAWLASLDKNGEAPTPAEPAPFDPATLQAPEKSTSIIDPALLKTGRQQFMVCGACHGQSGEGTAAGPPLASSEWVTGPEENLIRIQLRGLKGPITVKGQEYHFPAGMAALAYQNDEQIAAVLTYIRNSFGNTAPPVTAAAVAALRSEVGKPPLVATDLVPPTPPSTSKAAHETVSPAAQAAPGKYEDLTTESPWQKWLVIAAVILISGAIVRARWLRK